MVWHAFVDLARRLSDVERRALFDAVDEIVPNSGCVGPNRSGVDEVYFTVEADDDRGARACAVALIDLVLARAGLVINYAITLHEAK